MHIDFSQIKGFEWDKGNLEHIKKHNVEYKECEEIFYNKPLLVSFDEGHSQAEERFKALGVTRNGRLLFLSFTIRNKRFRVISARAQNRKERTNIQKIGGENK